MNGLFCSEWLGLLSRNRKLSHMCNFDGFRERHSGFECKTVSACSDRLVCGNKINHKISVRGFSKHMLLCSKLTILPGKTRLQDFIPFGSYHRPHSQQGIGWWVSQKRERKICNFLPEPSAKLLLMIEVLAPSLGIHKIERFQFLKLFP